MHRLSPDNFGASENILTKLFHATWRTLVHVLTNAKCSYTVSCLPTIINFADAIIDMMIVMHIGF